VRKDEKIFIKKMVALATMVLLTLSSGAIVLHYRKYHWIDRGILVAKVNGIKIYRKDLEAFLSHISEKPEVVGLTIEKLDSQILEAIVMEIYLNKMIYGLAEKNRTAMDNNIRFSAREYYEKLVREKFLNERLFAQICEKDLVERYHQLAAAVENMEERKISHIVVRSENEAERIKNVIHRFNNFESMAKQKSIDRESADEGGSLGYVIKERIDIPELAEVAFLLKVGEISRPIETKNGWHIVRVDDVRNVKIKTYEESKEELLEQLKQEKFDTMVYDVMHKPKIKIFATFGKNNHSMIDNNNTNDVDSKTMQDVPGGDEENNHKTIDGTIPDWENDSHYHGFPINDIIV
jgi:parvulin-like peptidyl-prolyl isomerase